MHVPRHVARASDALEPEVTDVEPGASTSAASTMSAEDPFELTVQDIKVGSSC